MAQIERDSLFLRTPAGMEIGTSLRNVLHINKTNMMDNVQNCDNIPLLHSYRSYSIIGVGLKAKRPSYPAWKEHPVEWNILNLYK
jgi:hypothetical protein